MRAPGTKLNQLGLDSLIAAEIQHILQSDYNVELTNQELMLTTAEDLTKLVKGNTYLLILLSH